jgi:predicted methyltransferase
LITSEIARKLLEGEEKISLDLGITETIVKNNEIEYFLNEIETINAKDLEKIASDKRSIYFVENNKVFMAATTNGHLYKLVNTTGAPTLEIDGIRMHRTKNTTPDKDTEDKLKLLGTNIGNVLDTCTGLGYTAIQAHQYGANFVTTIENEPNVVKIAILNPWSNKLFTEPSIHKIIGDSFYVIDSFPINLFDTIIHDPPRHRSAGHLISKDFYYKLSRILKTGGKMFHYTGEPGTRYRGVNIHRGIKKRLNLAGFTKIVYHPIVRGFTCVKDTT